jgi:flagellar L-ring protein FlgH
MIKPSIVLLFAATAMLAFADHQDENPGSLWPSDYHDALKDRTAHQVGDILTILISETSSASFTAQTTTSKTDSTTIPSIGVPVIGGLLHSFQGANIGANSSTNGQGSTNQTGAFIARMTVVVTKVFSNGTMEIQGTRSVRVNKDTKNIILTGLVRKEDVLADNTIASEKIANAVLKTDDKGQIAERQRRGFLTHLLDWLF